MCLEAHQTGELFPVDVDTERVLGRRWDEPPRGPLMMPLNSSVSSSEMATPWSVR